jgi:hypothetical protein
MQVFFWIKPKAITLGFADWVKRGSRKLTKVVAASPSSAATFSSSLSWSRLRKSSPRGFQKSNSPYQVRLLGASLGFLQQEPWYICR